MNSLYLPALPILNSALAKIAARIKEFTGAGWTRAHLTCCAIGVWGHHGLAMVLRPWHDIGRIWEHVVELLGRVDGTGERSRTYYWRGACEAALRALIGPGVVPVELAEEWRRAKL